MAKSIPALLTPALPPVSSLYTCTEGWDFKSYCIYAHLLYRQGRFTDLCIEGKPKNLVMLCLRIINKLFIIL